MNQNPVEPPSGNDGGPDSGRGGGRDNREGREGHDGGFDAALVVPDDARELERDVEAWHREERWLRRRRRFERLFHTRRWHEHGISGPLIALILIGVAVIGATISILTPHETRLPTSPAKLALAAPSAARGTTHGLLPDVVLVAADDQPTPARDLRPGVVAIVTADCQCQEALIVLAQETTRNALPVYLVSDEAQKDQLDQLADETSEYDVHPLVDPTDGLINAYLPRGLTVVPVHADGVTDAVVRDYTGERALGPVLIGLKQAGPA